MQVARKRFGQHFLQDKMIIQHIMDVIAPATHQHLVEIGPGQGALTLPLLKKVEHLDVIELDRDLIPQLRHRCKDKGNLTIHEADALDFNYDQLGTPHHPIRLVGNLPYNISTPLIFHLLTFSNIITDMHFMLQKEVVDRLAAGRGSKTYSRLSIMVQYHCRVQTLFDVGPEAFYPPPQVESSVVRLMPHDPLPVIADDYAHFAQLVKTAFSHRRKTLRNCLKTMVANTEWDFLPVDSQLRPEQLSVNDYVKLSNLLVKNHGNVCDR